MFACLFLCQLVVLSLFLSLTLLLLSHIYIVLSSYRIYTYVQKCLLYCIIFCSVDWNRYVPFHCKENCGTVKFSSSWHFNDSLSQIKAAEQEIGNCDLLQEVCCHSQDKIRGRKKLHVRRINEALWQDQLFQFLSSGYKLV